MSWQKCPVCSGTGYDPSPGTFGTMSICPTCPTCQGTRIISELSGLPPIYNPNLTTKPNVSNIPSTESQIPEPGSE